jgi:RNA polymerase sigma factor (sigma-70 family)
MTRAAAMGELPREGISDREAALDALAKIAAERGMRIAVRLLGVVDAEDAVQEALAKTCRDFARVREPEAWFVRVLVNHCLRVQRRRRIWRWFRPDPLEPAPSAEDLVGRADVLHALRARVNRLPAMQRTAIVLRYAEELPVADVAGAMGIAETTVKKHLARALARLRGELGRNS